MNRRAFTLIEVLLASALSVVLLSGLWAAFSIYAKLFETAEAKAVHAQLVRGLSQQLTDDLRAAIQDTAEIPQGAATVRRFGLFGSATDLQIDVMLPVSPSSMSAPMAGLDSLSEPPPAKDAYELRTIRYRFRAPAETTDGTTTDGSTPSGATPEGIAAGGLIRQESDFRPSDAAAVEDPTLMEAITGKKSATAESDVDYVESLVGGADEESDDLSALDMLALTTDERVVTVVPEVASIEFRYFDGSEWYSTWNSIQRKALPIAVEVLLQMSDPKKANASTTEETPPAPESTDLLSSDSEGSNAARGLVRVVVYLPTSAMRADTSVPPATVGEDAGSEIPDGFSGVPDPQAAGMDPMSEDPLAPQTQPGMQNQQAGQNQQSPQTSSGQAAGSTSSFGSSIPRRRTGGGLADPTSPTGDTSTPPAPQWMRGGAR